MPQDKNKKTGQLQSHVDYRNSDDYQDEIFNRAEALQNLPQGELENEHLGRLARSGRAYSYKRAMEDSKPQQKVATDNTRVTPKKNK